MSKCAQDFWNTLYCRWQKKQLADLIQNMISKATKSSEKNIASLNYQLDELKNSQSFVSRKHDDLAGDCSEILQTNK